MVYECPQCKAPLPPGAMTCAKCGLQFATPIPADATVPSTLAATTQETTSYSPLAAGSNPPSKAIAAVVVLAVVLVAAALFAIYSFSQTSVSSAPPVLPPVSRLPPPPTPGVPPGGYPRGSTGMASSNAPGSLAPIQLSGGASSSSGAAASSSNDAEIQGRWQAKNMDFYVFNAGGAGARGNTNNPGKIVNFTWAVTNNQLIINAQKEERLTFSLGPDASVLYLRLDNNRYVKFMRTDNS